MPPTRNNGRITRLVIDLIVAVYLAFTAGLLVQFRNAIEPWFWLVVLHVTLITGIIALQRVQKLQTPVIGFIRDWYPVFLVSPLFKEVELLATVVGNWSLTGHIQELESLIFGVQWSLQLSEVLPYPLVSEYLHFCYISYILLLPLVGGIWYFGQRWAEFDRLILLAITTYLLSYLFFIFFPVDSPFYLVPPPGEPLAGHFFYELVHWVSSRGGARGGAFPSSHVSVSIVVWLTAFRYDRRLAYLLLPIVLGIAVATVYGRFHYVLDVVAGGLLAIVILLIHRFIESLQAR